MFRTLMTVTLAVSALPACEGADRPLAEPAGGSAQVFQPIRQGQSRYGWEWLAQQQDKNGDAKVTREEFSGSPEHYRRLDLTWDGQLTADDFDWSTDGPLTRRKETAFALFKPIDTSSNGRISAEEWQAVFVREAGEKGYLDDADLERLVFLPRVVKTQRERKGRFQHRELLLDYGEEVRRVPAVDELAPDFTLSSSDGRQSVQLSSFRGEKPVVLIFGCLTCGNYRTYTETLEVLYQHYKNEVEFLRVYVREAHPSDDQNVSSTNAAAGILIQQPKTLEERCSVADRFTSEMKIQTPMVVDGIDNEVGRTYGGWPDRLYVIDRGGKVAFQGGPGPFAFNPREMEQALLLLLLAEK
ncbi:MAG: deiodinase family protein [Planctomycetaceae bacterium]|nr:deiodinase family protein [Planctomycetaceae bacterium]